MSLTHCPLLFIPPFLPIPMLSVCAHFFIFLPSQPHFLLSSHHESVSLSGHLCIRFLCFLLRAPPPKSRFRVSLTSNLSTPSNFPAKHEPIPIFPAPTPVLTCSLSGFAALTCPNRTQDCCLRCEPGVKDDQQAKSQKSVGESKARRSPRPRVCLGKPRGRRRRQPEVPALGFLALVPSVRGSSTWAT